MVILSLYLTQSQRVVLCDVVDMPLDLRSRGLGFDPCLSPLPPLALQRFICCHTFPTSVHVAQLSVTGEGMCLVLVTCFGQRVSYW